MILRQYEKNMGGQIIPTNGQKGIKPHLYPRKGTRKGGPLRISCETPKGNSSKEREVCDKWVQRKGRQGMLKSGNHLYVKGKTTPKGKEGWEKGMEG